MHRRRGPEAALLLSPALLLWGGMFVIPLGLLVWMSLHNWPLAGTIRFAGLDNYVRAIDDSTFWESLGFTARYTLLVTPIQVIGGYLLAVLVRTRWAGVGFFRSIYFVPVVIGFAAAAYVFQALVAPGYGLLDGVFNLLGLKKPQTLILADPTLALSVTILLNVWKSVGVAMVLFMAGMQAIPQDLYESAQVDGANRRQMERWITIPLVRRTLALVLILTVAGSILAFDQFYILTRGGPQGQTLTTVLWIYTVSFVRFRLGYGAALSIILLALLTFVTAFQLRALRQEADA